LMAKAMSEKASLILNVCLDSVFILIDVIGIKGDVQKSPIKELFSSESKLLGLEEIAKDIGEAAQAGERARAWFNLIKAVFDVTGLATLVRAIFTKFSVWDWIKTGLNLVASITALFATAAIAFLAKVALMIMDVVDLVKDTVELIEVIKAEKKTTTPATTSSKTTEPHEIKSGGKIANGARLVNGNYRVNMQGDGNLVLYEDPGSHPKWSAQSDKSAPAKIQAGSEAFLEKDGHLYLRKAGKQVWKSKNSHDGPGPYTLTLQGDRNFVIYDKNGKPLWSTNTQT